MRINIEFDSEEEEFLYMGTFVAIDFVDKKIIRDNDGFLYWDYDEDMLVAILRGIDYNDFGTFFVEDPSGLWEDFKEEDEFYDS